MATTSNFGWTTPDDTDLVRDGASAIRSLGSAIDSSLYSLNPAGKNKIINGDFRIWQRGTTLTVNSGNSVYLADRWKVESGVGTAVCSQQAFTIGQTDVPNNPAYFLRMAFSVSGGAGTQVLSQWIENVSTFAGQTVTLSFYAKISTGTQSLEAQYVQRFGSGGSSAVAGVLGTMNLTTAWQKFTFTGAIPSISGKTVGANNALQIRFIGNPATVDYDFANVQLETGNLATAFQTATGTLAGELAACQRYYWRIGGSTAIQSFANGVVTSTTFGYFHLQSPVVMRTTPTSVDAANLKQFDSFSSINITSVAIDNGSPLGNFMSFSGTGFTANRPCIILAQNTNAYLGLSAEL